MLALFAYHEELKNDPNVIKEIEEIQTVTKKKV
jgi:hypothetical protein